jgi:hypothetical protein
MRGSSSRPTGESGPTGLSRMVRARFGSGVEWGESEDALLRSKKEYFHRSPHWRLKVGRTSGLQCFKPVLNLGKISLVQWLVDCQEYAGHEVQLSPQYLKWLRAAYGEAEVSWTQPGRGKTSQTRDGELLAQVRSRRRVSFPRVYGEGEAFGRR